MGLFVGQDQKRSELQSKVAADLRERLGSSSTEGTFINDYESKSLENQHETRPAGVIIGVLLLIVLGVGIYAITQL